MIRRHAALGLAIGLQLLSTQQVSAQEGLPPGTFQLREHAEELKARFKRAFDPALPVDWKDGWRLALESGPALAPFLAEQLRQESSVKRRLLWIGALVLCCGTEQEEPIVALLGTGKRVEEKVFTALAVALLGARPGTGEIFARHLGEVDEDLVQVAFALALGRYVKRAPGAAPGRLVASEDPALAAAGIAALGRDAAPNQAAIVERWFRDRADVPRAELARRAVLLSELVTVPDPVPFARAIWSQNPRFDTKGASTTCAALCLARRADPRSAELPAEPVPGSGALIALCSEPAWRTECLARGWLVPVPKLVPNPGGEDRRRLASAYALAAGPDRLRLERELWQRDRDTAGTVVRELAVQILRVRAEGAKLEPFTVEAGDSTERAWLEVAFGLPTSSGVGSSLDATAQRALQAAASGSLSPGAAANELEAALVRLGSRPECVRGEAVRALVRDILLAGSRLGALRYAGGKEPNGLPRGIPPSRDDFFEPAVEFYEFVSRTVPEAAPRSPLR